MNTTSTISPSATLGESGGLRSFLTALARTDGSIGSIVLRLALAVVIFPHGAQKLLGWWGGYGFSGSMGFFTEKMGIPWILAFGAIVIEFFAPFFLLAGFGTRLAALALGTVLATAMFQVQLPHGFFMNWFGNQKGEGIEFTLLFLGISLALVLTGAGRWSVDRALSQRA